MAITPVYGGDYNILIYELILSGLRGTANDCFLSCLEYKRNI